MDDTEYPPKFTVDDSRVLNLFTGVHFYSSSDASIREAILNAIDAVGRRPVSELPDPSITVVFDEKKRSITISDHGVGMDKGTVTTLFSKIGASAAQIIQQEQGKQSQAIGQFGIGVLSYFLVCDVFEIHTVTTGQAPLALEFPKEMLNAQTRAKEIACERTELGTTLILRLREKGILEELRDKFSHWVRDVPYLEAWSEPGKVAVAQGGLSKEIRRISVEIPDWIHEANIGPPRTFDVWDHLDGLAHVDVLYKGVFVERVDLAGLWGIEGAVHVDPKHFKPLLNREGFVGQALSSELAPILKLAHPLVLEAALECVAEILGAEQTSDWSLQKWITLWLAIPTGSEYQEATRLWDEEFRNRPAFRQLLPDDKTEMISVATLKKQGGTKIYIAPDDLRNAQSVVRQAVKVLRSRGATVLQGLIRDQSYLSNAAFSLGSSTEALLLNRFRDELPQLLHVVNEAESLVSQEARIDIYHGPPAVKLVDLGPESEPIIAISNEVWINADLEAGKQIVRDICDANDGHMGLWIACLQHAPNQVPNIAKIVRTSSEAEPERLGPVKRQYIRHLVQ